MAMLFKLKDLSLNIEDIAHLRPIDTPSASKSLVARITVSAAHFRPQRS